MNFDWESIEAQLGAEEQNIEQLEKQKNDIESHEAGLQKALVKLETDVQVSEKLAQNQIALQTEKHELSKHLQRCKEQFEGIQQQIQGFLIENDESWAVIEELQELGEDVSDSIQLIQDRAAILKECQIHLQQLAERLGIVLDELHLQESDHSESLTEKKQESKAGSDGCLEPKQYAELAPPNAVKAIGQDWANKLSDEEYAALYAYTGTAYQNINEVLRGIKSNFEDCNHERAIQIHKALSRSRIPEECIVYRGASLSALGSYRNFSDEKLIGNIIYDNGFMSTSLNSGDAFGGEVRLELTVPQGAHGAYVGYLSQSGHYESEVLFDMGQMMRITDVRKDIFGRRIICARILI